MAACAHVDPTQSMPMAAMAATICDTPSAPILLSRAEPADADRDAICAGARRALRRGVL